VYYKQPLFLDRFTYSKVEVAAGAEGYDDRVLLDKSIYGCDNGRGKLKECSVAAANIFFAKFASF
jgi:hypothetical protein